MPKILTAQSWEITDDEEEYEKIYLNFDKTGNDILIVISQNDKTLVINQEMFEDLKKIFNSTKFIFNQNNK